MSIEIKLPRSKPESQGVNSSGIERFLKAVEDKLLDLHSFMLLRNGNVLAEQWWPPTTPESPNVLFSISKSFTSTAIGFAAAEGLLSIEDQVLSFFPEEVTPNIESNMSELRVRHLLTMTTGHAQDPTASMRDEADGNWIKGFLEIPLEEPPGTRFVYNSGASYLLSAIVHRVTGQTLLNYLQPRLFKPLGIMDITWDTCPKGIECGGWGLHARTEDIAKFGQLYLQKGSWNGKQLLSESWVEDATMSHITTERENGIDKQQGYGYQFYRCRYDAYCARGANGQFCIVVPERNAVIVITSRVTNMQEVLDLVWDNLVSEME
ncbi:CubicO group peptidase, beta-lactamase class C family [Paenibacillus sp. 1_12]|uniref:serine hydrolase domain-containing protein n=1 Tax=Paenibacillus sp. 1_12 TaxID=1566278 RepID=UPI0008E610B4|nr:serine hydrolase [Paenibacillus sp. 1_12]SFL08001.1 CubicO group peptidase, beta-lactamase class C family [Paenibacillus sp. 1_12]